MTVLVEMVDERGKARIWLRSPYSPSLVSAAKSIGGGRWRKDDRVWSYPLDLTTCKLLRQAFGDQLEIGPALTAWARQEVQRSNKLNDFHVATSAEPVDLPLVRTQTPTMWAAMQARGYQTVVPEFAKAVGSHFNGSQPGAGKTIETLATLVECGVGPMVLVAAPKKAIQGTWPQEVAKWIGTDLLVDVQVVDSEVGTIPEREAKLAGYFQPKAMQMRSSLGVRFNFIMINPEMLRWTFACDDPTCNGKRKECGSRKSHKATPQHPSLFNIKWDAIILDETHKVMMNANKLSASVSGWGYGAQKLKLAENGMKIGLSGTPFKGKPRRFWTMLNWLRPDVYTSQWKWTEQYFEMDANPFAGFSGKTATDRMRADREDIFNDDLSRILIRHTKRELRKINPAWAPPEKIHVDVPVFMSAKQAKAYHGMAKEATAALESGTLMANGVLAELTRLKQLATAYGTMSAGSFTPALPSAKWEWVEQALEERGLAKGMNDGDVKIVIASQFVAVLDVFAAELDRLGIAHFQIDGRTKNVSAIQEAWQSSQTDVRVLLLSTHAGGVSLTLDAADDLVLVDETFVPDDQEQVEDRVHRTSRTDHQVTIYHLIAQDTIDQTIAEGNLTADMTQKAVLDGRRGVEFARKILSGGSL